MFALGTALCVAFLTASVARAADAPAAASVPVTATFEKVSADGVNGYALNLKNVSNDTLKLTVTITPSVVFHADAKVRTLPEHAVDAGQVWTIKDLSAGDKLSVSADGFSKLDLTVP
jgi:hypothetical protein